jgi:hypothetical protein
LHGICNAGDPESICYVAPIESLVSALKRLQSFRLHLHTASDFCVVGILEFIDKITALPKLTELKTMSPHPSACTTVHPVHIATWTEQDGLKQDHEAIKLCHERALV